MTIKAYDDTGHPPSADHRGEVPRNELVRGPHGLKVTLESWGPKEGLARVLYQAVTQTWGDEPHRVEATGYCGIDEYADITGWCCLNDGQREMVRKLCRGDMLAQAIEMVTFAFQIEGVTRAATHQLVRTRLGAGMMQHGGRDNDWRHRDMTIPESVWRAMQLNDEPELKQVVQEWVPISEYLNQYKYHNLQHAVVDTVQRCRDLYAALVDAGIQWQDARRFLPMVQTNIWMYYNWVSLRDVLSNRLEHIMDWEINCIAQLMLRELRMKCPAWLVEHFGSHSDRAGKALWRGMKIRPPDQKYPAPYKPEEYETTALQNPFWVLSEESMRGGPIEWIPTNGVYPGRPDGILREEP